jgi:hypothetical protein
MASSLPPILHRQLARVSRRLFAQTLLDCLVWCWAVALVLSVGWFLLQPYAVAAAPEWLRWAVAGGAVGAGTLLAVALAVVWTPSRLAAALLLDERFGLKERVTTSLTLPEELEATPAGRALLQDVTQKVGGLQVGERFPLRVSWASALVPAGLLTLGLLAVFYNPQLNKAAAGDDDLKQPVANAKEIDKQMEKLLRKPRQPEQGEKSDRSKDLERIEAELKDLVKKPRTNKEQLLDVAKEMTQVEGELKKHQQDMADKAKSLKDQLKQMDKMTKKKKDGPAKDLEKALEQGKFDEAKKAVDELAKKLKNDELTEKEKQQLAEQVQEMKDKLQKLARQQDKMDKLKEMADKGQLDPEALKREMDNLKQNSEKLKDLKEIADQLEQCQNCLKEGDCDKAGESLSRAAEKLQKMASEDEELQELEETIEDLKKCKACIGENLSNRAGIGAGKRPEAKDGDYKPLPSRVRVDFDKAGQKEVIDYVPGNAYKKKSSAEIAGQVIQASQEAPEAVERQRLPRAASEMTKRYYEKLREETEKDKPK